MACSFTNLVFSFSSHRRIMVDYLRIGLVPFCRQWLDGTTLDLLEFTLLCKITSLAFLENNWYLVNCRYVSQFFYKIYARYQFNKVNTVELTQVVTSPIELKSPFTLTIFHSLYYKWSHSLAMRGIKLHTLPGIEPTSS